MSKRKVRFGKAFRGMRKGLGLQQVQWGKILGVSQSFVSKLERGDQKPNLEQICRLVKYLW